MTELSCTVDNCAYYEDHCCCKGDITIEGSKAHDKGETCCGSFRPRSEGAARNSIQHPSHNIDVDCEAKNCCHNDDCKCNASHVGVGGNRACTCGETQCTSFEER